MKNNKYFDFDLAMRYLANNKSILDRVIVRFLENYKDFIIDIEMDTYEKIHSLKGITLNLGCEILFNECQMILLSIKKGEKINLDSFKYCFEKSYNALKTYIDEN